jgi:DICT domain-containing protein
MMKLERLSISRSGWGKDMGKLTGEIEFDNQHAKVTVKLSEDKANKILAIIAEQIVENAREVSALLVQEVLDGRIIPAPDVLQIGQEKVNG